MFAFPHRMRDTLIALGMTVPFAGAALAAPPPHPKPVRHHHVQFGKASFYAGRFAGRKTASGERMSPSKLTAASKTLPLGTKAQVTNLDNGRSVAVTVNDRGPYAAGRVIDVSPKAADKLDMKEDGVASVAVKPLSVPQPAK
jgi:rare lipoprotein A